jgi:transmembrane sensor
MKPMTRLNEQDRAVLTQQASEWYVANRSGTLSRGDAARFIDWLRASPAHVEEYLGVAQVDRALAAAVSDEDESMDTLIERARADVSSNVTSLVLPDREQVRNAVSPPRRRWSSVALPVAAAVAAMAIGITVVMQNLDGQRFGLPKTYQTAHGQQLERTLPDGTTLQLNTDSAVTVRYTVKARVVELTRGQAYFQVVHNARRPFRVSVDGAELVDVGTSFDVYRLGSNTILTVIQGQVAVVQSSSALADRTVVAATDPLVGAGQRIRLEHGAAISPPQAVDLLQAQAWLKRQVIFRARPLGEAVAELNRYAPTQLEIRDPAVRVMAVSGVFNADDTESFIAFINTMDGLAVQQVSPGNLLIARRAPAETPAPSPMR